MSPLEQFPRTRIDEIADGVFRISSAVGEIGVPGGFSFNQYLVRDEAPLLFHSGPRRLFPATRAAIASVMPVEELRYIAFSHVEADECGALNDFLAAAPRAVPVCSKIAAMVSIEDLADRPPKALGEGEELRLGRRTLTWLDAPHVPHAWDCGYLADRTGRLLFCGDLFTQPGAGHAPLIEDDILEPSESMRQSMDYFAHGPSTGAILAKLAALRPTTLACMHGSAWDGDGAALLAGLARRLAS